MESSTVLFVILPGLIFEASTDIDWHTFKHELPQILPLATTVVLGSALLNSLALKWIIPAALS